MTENESQEDERSTQPPPETPPEEGADEGEAGEAPGPLGNPAADEEALRNRQQETGEGQEPGEGAD